MKCVSLVQAAAMIFANQFHRLKFNSELKWLSGRRGNAARAAGVCTCTVNGILSSASMRHRMGHTRVVL
jgi:hypothetical protein